MLNVLLHVRNVKIAKNNLIIHYETQILIIAAEDYARLLIHIFMIYNFFPTDFVK